MNARRYLAASDCPRRVQSIHFRHLHVHQNQIKRFLAERLTASSPSFATVTRCPHFSSSPIASFLIDQAVFGEQHRLGIRRFPHKRAVLSIEPVNDD